MSPSHPDTPDAPAWDMSITVGENTARLAGLTRADVDEWAALTHQRACASIDAGCFDDEIVPVEVPDGAGGTRQLRRRRAPPGAARPSRRSAR